MAKVFLETGDDFRIVNDNTTVYGVAGDDTDSIIIEEGTTGIIVNANVDRIDFAGNIADFRFEAGFGANMMVYSADGTTLLATIPIQEDANGTQLVFADGAVASIFTAGTGITTGGVALTETPAAIVPAAANIDTTVTTEAELDPGVAGPTFSVAASDASVTEGGDATFTVSLSAAQGTVTRVLYTLAGTGGAVLGTDTAATAVTAALIFAPGETTKTITVPVTFDTTVETGEGMTLTLSAPSTGTVLGTSSAAVAFADPAAPTFTMTSDATAGQSTEEGNIITYTITPSTITDKAYTFTLSSGASTTTVTGATAADATDFTPASTTVTFAAGATAAQTVTQTVYADGVSEGLQSYSTVLLDSSLATVATLTGLISDATGGTATGSTFSLTAGADVLGPNSTTASLKTTTGGDTIYGLTVSSFTSADIIDASTGTDVLIADYDLGAADLTIAPILTSVENITLKATGTTNVAKTLTFNAANSTGLTNLTFSDVTGGDADMALVGSNLGAGVTTGISNSVTAGADTYTFKYTDAALAGTSDAVTLNVTGNTTDTGAVKILGTSSTAAGAGAETLNIVTSGTGSTAASKLASVLVADGGGVTSSLKTLNVSGTSDLTITGALDFAGTTSGGTIDATGMAGNLTLDSSTDKTTFTGGSGKSTITTGAFVNTLTGGANNDTFNLGAGTDSVTGGAGNDTVSAAIGSFTATDTIVLGDGTRDAIIYTGITALNSTGAGVSAAQLAVLNGYTGVEVVGSSAAITAIDAGYFTQSVFRLTGDLTADVAVSNVANDTLELTGNGIEAGSNVGLTASGALPNQTFNLEMNGSASQTIDGADGGATDYALSITTGISTVKILSTTSATSTSGIVNAITASGTVGTTATNTTEAVNNASAGSFELTGNVDFTVGDGKTAGFTKAVDFNASTFTGKLNIQGSASADVIKGGSGADTINGLGGNDILTGNGGVDKFVMLGDTIPSGNDTITDFAVGTTGDKIDLGFLTVPASLTAVTMTGAKATAADTIYTVNYGAAIGSTDFTTAGATGFDLLFGAGKAFSTATTNTFDFLIAVQGTDKTVLLAFENPTATIVNTDIDAVVTLSGVTNAQTFDIANFV